MTAATFNDQFLNVAATPSDHLRELAARLVEMKEDIDGLEVLLSERKRELNDITHRRMVDAMVECGLTEMKLPDGHKFVLQQFVSGSLPKPADDFDEEGKRRRADAVRWLEENGASNLIKSELSVTFGRTEHNLALDTQQLLIERGLPAVLESGVHSQTLQAWAREAIKNGDEVPFDILGLVTGQYVKVTVPKGGKQ